MKCSILLNFAVKISHSKKGDLQVITLSYVTILCIRDVATEFQIEGRD